jgi:16S rRNA (guanine(966)-N(2))-methyltransferase RsmD
MHDGPRQVRIIGGQWKRTRLTVPEVRGLRPSPDRVRETLFNWLNHLRPDTSALRGLDLFAGTGALGFELASRGARSVLLVESDRRALESLRATRARLAAHSVEVQAGDALAFAAALPAASFDVIFLDPPFDAGLQETALRAAVRLLATGGFVYLEAPVALMPTEAARFGLEIVRSSRAGRVSSQLLRPLTA